MLFCVVFRALKFSKNIPVMCSIGSTFSNAVADILLFLVVIFVLFIAFAMMFHVIFAFDMDSFAGLGVALFSVLALP